VSREEVFLNAFDANRDLICQTAAEVHSRDRKSRFELVGAVSDKSRAEFA
jgi:hypothetical protein